MSRSPKETFNIIVDTIELLVHGKKTGNYIETLSDDEIISKAYYNANCGLIKARTMNDIFNFLINVTVKTYVTQRRMMAAYNLLKEEGLNKITQGNMCNLAGVENYESFLKRFKAYFYVNPTEALKNGVKETYEKASWDAISEDKTDMIISFDDEGLKETKFGIDKEKLLNALIAYDLQERYNLSDYESDIAYSLSVHNNSTLIKAFEYVEYLVTNSGVDRKKTIDKILLDEKLIHMFFNCEMTFNEISIVLYATSEYLIPTNFKNRNKLYLLGFSFYVQCKRFYPKYAELYYDELYNIFVNSNNNKIEDLYFFLAKCNCCSPSEAIDLISMKERKIANLHQKKKDFENTRDDFIDDSRFDSESFEDPFNYERFELDQERKLQEGILFDEYSEDDYDSDYYLDDDHDIDYDVIEMNNYDTEYLEYIEETIKKYDSIVKPKKCPFPTKKDHYSFQANYFEIYDEKLFTEKLFFVELISENDISVSYGSPSDVSPTVEQRLESEKNRLSDVEYIYCYLMDKLSIGMTINNPVKGNGTILSIQNKTITVVYNKSGERIDLPIKTLFTSSFYTVHYKDFEFDCKKVDNILSDEESILQRIKELSRSKAEEIEIINQAYLSANTRYTEDIL